MLVGYSDSIPLDMSLDFIIVSFFLDLFSCLQDSSGLVTQVQYSTFVYNLSEGSVPRFAVDATVEAIWSTISIQGQSSASANSGLNPSQFLALISSLDMHTMMTVCI